MPTKVYNEKIVFLKVKLKSLAAESRIIRKEERKTNGWRRDELRAHRIHKVRSECRDTHLAYGLIRGKSVDQIERTVKENKPGPNWKNVRSMVQRYGGLAIVEAIFTRYHPEKDMLAGRWRA